MSILNQNYVGTELVTAENEVYKLKLMAKLSYDRLRTILQESTEKFWRNPSFTPQQMAAAAGTECAELFALHGLLVSVLEQASPGSTQDIVSMVSPYTVNPDGSVTIS